MLNAIKKLIGLGPRVDYKDLVKNGAVIVDVRTRQEYAAGHIKHSINIPVDQLGNNLNKLKDKVTPIITCCASGMRSANAKNILMSKGYQYVYNGGAWSSLKNKI